MAGSRSGNPGKYTGDENRAHDRGPQALQRAFMARTAMLRTMSLLPFVIALYLVAVLFALGSLAQLLYYVMLLLGNNRRN